MSELIGSTFDTAQNAMLTSENSHSSLKCLSERGVGRSLMLKEGSAIVLNDRVAEHLQTATPVASDEIGWSQISTDCFVF